jgi:hypothetical protein
MSLLQERGQRGGAFKDSFLKPYRDLFCRYLALYMIPEKEDEEEENLRVETIAAQLADIDYQLSNYIIKDSKNTIAPDIRKNIRNVFLRMQNKPRASSVADEKYLDKSNFLIHEQIMTTTTGKNSFFNEQITPILQDFEKTCTSAVSKEECLKEIDKFVLHLDEQYETQQKMILFLITLRTIIIHNRGILTYKMNNTLQRCSNAVINCYSKSTSPQKEQFSKLFFELSSLNEKSYVSINEYKVGFIIPTTNKKWLIDFMYVLGSVGITIGATALGSCLVTPIVGMVAAAIATAGCAASRTKMVEEVEKKRNEQLLHDTVKSQLRKFAKNASKECAIDAFKTCIQWINEYKNEAFENFDKYIYLYEILFAQYRSSFPETYCGNIIESDEETETATATATATASAPASAKRSARIAKKTPVNYRIGSIWSRAITKKSSKKSSKLDSKKGSKLDSKKGSKLDSKKGGKRTRKTRR